MLYTFSSDAEGVILDFVYYQTHPTLRLLDHLTQDLSIFIHCIFSYSPSSQMCQFLS